MLLHKRCHLKERPQRAPKQATVFTCLPFSLCVSTSPCLFHLFALLLVGTFRER